MAAEDPRHAFQTADQDPIFPHGLDKVLRTARFKTTAPAQQGANGPAINDNQQDQDRANRKIEQGKYPKKETYNPPRPGLSGFPEVRDPLLLCSIPRLIDPLAVFSPTR